jgi:AcrR family transcriptional regulator
MGVAVKKANEAEVSHNLAGQKLGRKGQQTRERIIAAATELLSEPGDAPISLTAVARRAKLGMTSLYLYFADLTELLLAIIEPVVAEAEETYVRILRKRWDDDKIEESARLFMECFFAYWERHTSVLHLRNTMADQYDERMMASRVGMAIPTIELIRGQLRNPKSSRQAAAGVASMLYSGIERNVNLATDRTMPSRLAAGFTPPKQMVIDAGVELLTFAIRHSRGLAD